MTTSLFPNLAPPQAPKSTKMRFLRALQARILRHAISHGTVHADEALAGLDLPVGVHPNVIGLAFSGLSDACLIEPVDFRRSIRAARHRGVSRVWRVCDMKGSRAYLTALKRAGDMEE